MHRIPTLERPRWTARRQLAIILRDCSGSMNGQKARDAQAACEELVKALAGPRNKGAFDVAIIDFSDDAKVVCSPTPADTIRIPGLNVDSMTDITKAAQAAEKVILGVSEDQARPVVVLLSDGAHNGSGDPVATAENVKLHADIVSVAFGDDADEQMLTKIASSPQHFYRCQSGQELRSFFNEVGTTMSVAMHSRNNATSALAQMQVE